MSIKAQAYLETAQEYGRIIDRLNTSIGGAITPLNGVFSQWGLDSEANKQAIASNLDFLAEKESLIAQARYYGEMLKHAIEDGADKELAAFYAEAAEYHTQLRDGLITA